jgi:uncharacterized NAD(P)/FAD-binding protein YdhS
VDRVKHVVVAGGGASGALLAANLLRLARRPLRVTVVDPSPSIGRGRAYAEGPAEHLLNVRAAGMSALADDPGHFVRWLSARNPGLRAPEDAFAPRPLYGEYLGELLDACRRTASPGVELEQVRDTVDDAEADEDGVRCVLASGRRLESDRLALATGHAPSRPPLPPPAGSAWRWADPLDASALDGLHADAPIAVVGTGLTLVDLVARLDARGHRGVVHAVSRRGLLPRAHPDAPRRIEALPWWALPRDARGLASAVRRLAALHPHEDGTRAVESLRSVTDSLWRELPDREKSRFLRHLFPLWNVHRHRMPPETARVVGAWARDGRLRLLPGRVIAVGRGAKEGALRLVVRPRGSVEPVGLDASRLFDATGPGDPCGAPLQMALITRGLARAHPSGLGLDVEPDGFLRSPPSSPKEALGALGPVARGTSLESTAIPEIRVQAARLAGSWTGRLC